MRPREHHRMFRLEGKPLRAVNGVGDRGTVVELCAGGDAGKE